MMTSSMAKRCCAREGPAFHSVTPSEPPSNFTDVVLWIFHDELNCLIAGILVRHRVFTGNERSLFWTVSLLRFNKNNLLLMHFCVKRNSYNRDVH